MFKFFSLCLFFSSLFFSSSSGSKLNLLAKYPVLQKYPSTVDEFDGSILDSGLEGKMDPRITQLKMIFLQGFLTAFQDNFGIFFRNVLAVANQRMAEHRTASGESTLGQLIQTLGSVQRKINRGEEQSQVQQIGSQVGVNKGDIPRPGQRPGVEPPRPERRPDSQSIGKTPEGVVNQGSGLIGALSGSGSRTTDYLPGSGSRTTDNLPSTGMEGMTLEKLLG